MMPSEVSCPAPGWPLRAITAGVAALAIGLACPAWAQFTPNETLVSPNPALIDPEFSQSRGKLAWTDPKGNLWLANVNGATGAFKPISGQGELIATGTVSKANMFLWNGPEWISMASGEQIYYSYYLPGKAPTAQNTRMALAVQDTTGAWVVQPLGPNVPRMADISSHTKGDPNAQIMYFDPQYNHYWRNALDASSEQLLSFLPAEDKAWRFATGIRAILYTATVGGVSQAFRYLLDTGVSEQLTFDGGDKDIGRTVPWMFPAPEFNKNLVLTTFVNGSELRVYRQLPGPGGSLRWTPIYSASLPAGSTAGSPQWLVYNGKSYVYWAVYVAPNDFPTEVWISNLDAADPLIRRISDDTNFRVRNDPEHFITTKYGPLIYYNRYDPSVDPNHPLCSACSEGVYRADPGLLGR
jgi:hypothetical protein